MQELLQERNAARDAPTEREFQLLYNAAFGSDSYIRQTEDRFLVYGTGRYGLRSGEELHFSMGSKRRADRDRKVIKVPTHGTVTVGTATRAGGYRQSSRGDARRDPRRTLLATEVRSQRS